MVEVGQHCSNAKVSTLCRLLPLVLVAWKKSNSSNLLERRLSRFGLESGFAALQNLGLNELAARESRQV